MKHRKYSLNSVDGGMNAVLSGPLVGESLSELKLLRPRRITIASETGWAGKSLDFLSEFSFLEELVIVDRAQIDDVSAIATLRSLRMLRLFTYAKGALDLSGLASLQEANIIWNPKFCGLGGCASLIKLHIEKLRQPAADELGSLQRLQSLDIMDTRIQCFDAIWELQGLESLRIALAPHLTNKEFRGIGRMRSLRQLVLQNCRQIDNIDNIAKCQSLIKLVVEDCSSIASIRPLAGLLRLQELKLPGNTNVQDGDLSVATELPELAVFSAANRRHYNPGVRDIVHQLERRYGRPI